jgi:uncharacterized protein
LTDGVNDVPAWLWWTLGSLLAAGLLLAVALVAACLHYRRKFVGQVVRIFEEKPLFIIPRGLPIPGAEDVSLRTPDGVTLRGCYLRGRGPRRGVILFGLEFGSNRWSCGAYCERLRDAGYDVFAYEPRNQGESERDPGYEPLQWVTDKDLTDARAAVQYLKARPDADPRGLGVFGISKGGSLGLMLASEDRAIRCVATDGAYATYTTVVPFMRRFVAIYSPHKRIQRWLPDLFYGFIGWSGIKRVAEKRKVSFPWLESAAKRVTQPVLMIHGGGDTYIKPEMARTVFLKLATPLEDKDFWLVSKAKHNQAPHVAPVEYPRRLVQFFDTYLGDEPFQLRRPPVAVDDATPLPVSRSLSVPDSSVAAKEVAPAPRLA